MAKLWICLVVVIAVIAISGCVSAPKRNFTDSNLLIDQTVMPPNWPVVEQSDSEENEGQVSGAYIIFANTETPYLDRAEEDVFHYSSASRAEWQYNRLKGYYFYDGGSYQTTPYHTPSGFIFSSSSAQRWKFACSDSNFTLGTSARKTSTDCEYLAQYQEFVIRFGITTEVDNTQFITIAQTVPIIKAIDFKISSYLSPSP